MLRPLRSSAIVRIAVETIVWSSAARNIPDMRPARMTTTCRWVKDDGASGATAPAPLPAGGGGGMRSPYLGDGGGGGGRRGLGGGGPGGGGAVPGGRGAPGRGGGG